MISSFWGGFLRGEVEGGSRQEGSSGLRWAVLGPDGGRVGVCDGVRVGPSGELFMSSGELGLFSILSAGLWSSVHQEEK